MTLFERFWPCLKDMLIKASNSSLEFQQNELISLFSTEGKCNFYSEIFALHEKSRSFFRQKGSVVHFPSEIMKITKVFIQLKLSHLGINLVPRDSTLIVAKFGRKRFD